MLNKNIVVILLVLFLALLLVNTFDPQISGKAIYFSGGVEMKPESNVNLCSDSVYYDVCDVNTVHISSTRNRNEITLNAFYFENLKTTVVTSDVWITENPTQSGSVLVFYEDRLNYDKVTLAGSLSISSTEDYLAGISGGGETDKLYCASEGASCSKQWYYDNCSTITTTGTCFGGSVGCSCSAPTPGPRPGCTFSRVEGGSCPRGVNQ